MLPLRYILNIKKFFRKFPYTNSSVIVKRVIYARNDIDFHDNIKTAQNLSTNIHILILFT